MNKILGVAFVALLFILAAAAGVMRGRHVDKQVAWWLGVENIGRQTSTFESAKPCVAFSWKNGNHDWETKEHAYLAGEAAARRCLKQSG